MLLGLVDAQGNLSGSPKAETVDGFWIALNYDEGVNSGMGIGELIFIDSGVKTSLATWAWDLTGINNSTGADTPWDIEDAEGSRADRVGLVFNYPVAVVLTVDAHSYALSFDAQGKPVPKDAISGTFSGALPVNSNLTNAIITDYCQGPSVQGIPTTLGFDLIAVGDPVIVANQALSPSPGNGAEDVLRDGVVLTWTPSIFALSHDVYWGDSFEDVNSATVPTVAGLDVNSFDPGRLEFDKAYFWRVDEVNDAPDKTVFKGHVWSFTAEPYSIQIPDSEIVVTASSFRDVLSGPENTINGSGLDSDGALATTEDTMWFTVTDDPNPWIQYEFDGVKQLDTMKVWNSNGPTESTIGWGVKDVEIVYSVDGKDWTVLPDVNEFSQALGVIGYNQYDKITFSGRAAKFVRLNIKDNWGTSIKILGYSLSEVQFTRIPAQARTPKPASGSGNLLPDAMATWRPGRNSSKHIVYLSTDESAVINGSAPSMTFSANAFDLSLFDVQLGETYYWRVDEVNDAETTTVWAGPVWSFGTVETLIVDDFETYNNISPNRPFQTWLDGYGYSSDEFFTVENGGNGTGAGIGHDIWIISSPHYNGQIMETDVTFGGSRQSMPLYFSNTDDAASQTDRPFTQTQDWTQAGIQTLMIHFYGDPNNTAGQLYVKINDVKVPYTEDDDAITKAEWTTWSIDLSSVGTDLSSVNTLSIGVNGYGSAGVIYLDDIVLSRNAPEVVDPSQADSSG